VRRAGRLTMLASRNRDGAPLTFRGEVWTDARGYAIVTMPRAAGRLHAGLDYELRPVAPGVTATIAAELSDGRFSIATDEPHVKVAWRVSEQRPQLEPKKQR